MKQSEGNALKATIVSKLNNRVAAWETNGFFYNEGKKLLLVPEGRDSTSLSLVCEFSITDDGATCQILRDQFSRQCGTFTIQRDLTSELVTSVILVYLISMLQPHVSLLVDFLNAGDTFSGTASFHDCVSSEDHQTSLVVTAAHGNAVRATVVSQVAGQIRSREVRGFFHIPSRQLIMVPDNYDSNTMGLVCAFDPSSDNDANCTILTDLMTRTCGSVGFSRDINGEPSHLLLQ